MVEESSHGKERLQFASMPLPCLARDPLEGWKDGGVRERVHASLLAMSPLMAEKDLFVPTATEAMVEVPLCPQHVPQRHTEDVRDICDNGRIGFVSRERWAGQSV